MQRNILTAIIFAIVLVLFFVLVMPQYDVVRAYGKAVNSKRALLNDRKDIFEKIKELNQQVQTRQADINKIKVFIPERKQIDEIVSSMQKITEQSGLQLLGLTTSEVPLTADMGYRKIFISADTLGTYPAFVNFLKLLEQNLRLYDVLDILAAASTTSPGNVNFTVKMNAYYLK